MSAQTYAPFNFILMFVAINSPNLSHKYICILAFHLPKVCSIALMHHHYEILEMDKFIER